MSLSSHFGRPGREAATEVSFSLESVGQPVERSARRQRRHLAEDCSGDGINVPDARRTAWGNRSTSALEQDPAHLFFMKWGMPNETKIEAWAAMRSTPNSSF